MHFLQILLPVWISVFVWTSAYADVRDNIQLSRGFFIALAFVALSAIVAVALLIFTRRLKRESKERMAAEQHLLESEERFRTLFDKSAEATLIIDGETFVDCNEATVQMLGYRDKGELLKTHPSDLSPEFQPDGQTSFKKAQEMMIIARKQGSHCFEWTHVRADGEPFPVEVVLTAIPLGDTYLLHTVWRDISARKKAEADRRVMEERLRQSQKMEALGTLAGGIAHDFNNILSAVLGYTELILLRGKLELDDKNSLETVRSAAERAKDLTKQILLFSRKMPKTKESVQIHLVAEEAVSLLRQTIPTTVDLKINIDPNTGFVLADATGLLQIIINLCTNAYHSLKNEKGEIEITLGSCKVDHATASEYSNLKEGSFALLTVRDTGTGMDSVTMSRIFEPFFTTKDQGKGTGMGLAVVHGIVKSFEGAIGVESTIGIGSTFKVFLPLTEAMAKDSIVKSDPPLQGGERILFIDDEPMLASLGKQLLETLGYDVFATSSAKEALEKFQANPDSFDLIITDQTMPEMTGNILAQEAMIIRPGIPVIICSGHSSVIDAEKAQAMGVRAFLMKPFDRRQLARTVRKVIDESV